MLLREGFAADGIKQQVRFANQQTPQVVLSGDVMYDNSLYFSHIAEQKSDIIERLGLTHRNFVLATIHRPANTDNSENLQSIFRALLDIADNDKIDIVLPLHPRTRKMLPTQLSAELIARIEQNTRLKIIEPASFFEIIRLEKHARPFSLRKHSNLLVSLPVSRFPCRPECGDDEMTHLFASS